MKSEAIQVKVMYLQNFYHTNSIPNPSILYYSIARSSHRCEHVYYTHLHSRGQMYVEVITKNYQNDFF